VWITVTLVTPPTEWSTLQAFYDKIKPLGPGWRRAVQTQEGDGAMESLPAAFLCWFLGCVVVYAALFGTGFFVYGRTLPGMLCLALVAASAVGLFKAVPRVGFMR
jgi:SSS family solute:Na+ symporter